MELTEHAAKLITMQPDIDLTKLNIAITEVSKISKLSRDQVAKLCVVNLIMKPEEPNLNPFYIEDSLELLRTIYRTYQENENN